jgi:hypothetical protein
MADGELMNRDDHLIWCKERAMAYWREGDLLDAVTSMASDLEKHPETKCHPTLLTLGTMYASHLDFREVRRWIEGFR